MQNQNSKSIKGDEIQNLSTGSTETLRAAVEATDGQTRLLPCPFCGGKAGKGFVDASEPLTQGRGDLWLIGCLSSRCATGHSAPTIEEAIQRWNTRAPQWQSIETAPKKIEWRSDKHEYGEYFLAYPVFGEVARVRWWQHGRTDGSIASNFLEDGGNAAHPTHWMPLPAGPEVNEPERDAESVQG